MLRGLTLLGGGFAFCAGLAVIAESQTSPSRSPAERPTLEVPPTQIGLNLRDVVTYYHQRSFANLVTPGRWFSAIGSNPWVEMPGERLTAEGWPKSLEPGEAAPLAMMRPAEPINDLEVRCTYDGTGTISSGGIARITSQRRGEIQLRLSQGSSPTEGWHLLLTRTDPADPFRNLDCREPSIPKNQLFAPQFLESLKGYPVLRFMDWQRIVNNVGGKWDRRRTADSTFQLGAEGVALEPMVALANEVDADPWFVMPYNADDRYIETFARYVHDNLEPGRKVYVELGNEVWNYGFPAASQALREGEAAGLGFGNDALLRRYAEKSKHALSIWTGVFSASPERLVRVVATQSVWSATAEIVLGHKDTASVVDALATAPYIQLDLEGKSKADLDWVFARTGAAVDEAIKFAAENKAIAAKYGKRYIAYEAGQHLVTKDMDFAYALQRDPRMEDVYRQYLEAWDSRIGDLLVLYSHVGPISQFGSWGLLEYAGQPIEDAPKMRAVQNFQKSR